MEGGIDSRIEAWNKNIKWKFVLRLIREVSLELNTDRLLFSE